MSAGAAAPPKVKRRPPFPRPRRTGGAHAGAVLDAPTAGHRQRTRERPAALIPDAAAIVSPTDDAHLLTALVQVPTDKGTFGVALVREGGNDWLAWRIVLPGMPAPTEAAR